MIYMEWTFNKVRISMHGYSINISTDIYRKIAVAEDNKLKIFNASIKPESDSVCLKQGAYPS